MDYPQMLSGILLIALMGYLLFASIDWLEKVVCRYRQS
jgi:NitT/TauT family transport system permease protein